MLSELRMALMIINKVKYCNIIRMSLGRRMMMAVAALLLPLYTAVAAYVHVDYDYKRTTRGSMVISSCLRYTVIYNK